MLSLCDHHSLKHAHCYTGVHVGIECNPKRGWIAGGRPEVDQWQQEG